MPKRKHTSYNMQQKLDCVLRIRNGETQAKVSREIGVPESTLRGWLKDEDKLRNFVADLDKEEGLQRKRVRLAADPALDKATFNWFAQNSTDVPLGGAHIMSQAKKFHQKMNGPEAPTFNASTGWLKNFKKRHGILQKKKNGEVKSADYQGYQDFIPEFRDFITNGEYTDQQIYNADETALYYRIMPEKGLALKRDKNAACGHKPIRDRVTLLFTCNRAGSHKLKPLMIGKFKSPRCFHHLNMKTLPMCYNNSKNAWMTAAIFKDWFDQEFVPSVRKNLRKHGLEEKAVLLLDNCPAHPPADTLKSKDGKIIVYYLPKNTTSLCQPLDQGIIANFKANYRKQLIFDMLEEENLQVQTYLKSLNLKDAVYSADKAWSQVTGLCIQRCWEKGLPHDTCNGNISDDDDDEELISFDSEQTALLTETFAEEVKEAGSLNELMTTWVECDDDVPVAEIQTEDEIISQVLEEDEESEEEEQAAPEPEKFLASKALEGLLYAQKFLESKGETLQAIQCQAFIRTCRKYQNKSRKQCRINDFFKDEQH